jgi:hypothetical protein
MQNRGVSSDVLVHLSGYLRGRLFDRSNNAHSVTPSLCLCNTNTLPLVTSLVTSFVTSLVTSLVTYFVTSFVTSLVPIGCAQGPGRV